MTAYFASCPKGLEYLLRDELVGLGAEQVREALAGVHFSGKLETAYRACLESRLASRILLPLTSFDAGDDAALYAGVGSIDWRRHLGVESTLAVDAVCVQSAIVHSRFAAQRVKDAIVDQLRSDDGARPSVDTAQPDVRIHLYLKRDRAQLSIDLAGAPLHQRGWRGASNAAPLKENLAAAILVRANWQAVYAAGGSFVDPMCGSGTLLIEAALMAADVAPGLHREYFGLLGWRGHDAELWQRLRSTAKDRADAGLRGLRPMLFGSDIDPSALAAAKANAQAAGVAGFIHLARHDVSHVTAPPGAALGLLACNPPYGERMGEHAELPTLYRSLGEVMRSQFPGWQAAVITNDAELGHALGLHAHKRYRLYNGAIECVLLLLDLKPEPVRELPPASPGAVMVSNRVRKTVRHLRKRMQAEGTSCYRIYDRDLPEYAAAVDLYAGRRPGAIASETQAWLHVQEYQAPSEVPEQVASERMRELIRGLGDALDVPRERMAVKTRRRGKGGSRYGRFDDRDQWLEVEEDGLGVLVNLFDYLDTGLFLDHRLVRRELRAMAQGQRFLNLFAYTAVASVHAAAGGAEETTSVDLSSTYLEWASRNLALNGFEGHQHRLVQVDTMVFLQQDVNRYGLIYVDPPTFSNSKSADDFDVQRDHVALLLACAERLERDGTIVFSNNFRRFKLDVERLSEYFEIEDWSQPSIPADFARNSRIHGCWFLRHK